MTEPFADTIDSMGVAARSQAIMSLNDSPDNAAEALRLGNATGVNPTVIHDDLDGFKSEYKGQLAGKMLRNNPELEVYVRSHPLAASVSNDDYGSLDEVSRSASAFDKFRSAFNAPANAVREALVQGGASAAEGWQGVPTSASEVNASAWMRDHPVYAAMAATARTPLELALRTMGAVAGGLTGAAKGAATEIGGEQFGKAIAGVTEYQLTKGEGHLPEAEAVAGQLARVRDAYTAAKPWIDAGVEPPRGLHQIIDEAKATTNADGVAKLNSMLEMAQESLTKERSPELFRGFVEQHVGEGTIGISGDSLVQMYGDKVPAVGDGLLGWVPGIEDKLSLARDTGADVHVPIKDWVTNVDPAVAKGLEQDIRVWPGGITAREAGFSREAPSVVEAPIAQVRGASALEPAFSLGDRKLTLGPDGSITGPDSSPIGRMEVTPEGPRIDGVNPAEIGPSALRDLLNQAGVPTKLDALGGIRSALNDAYWKKYGYGIEANVKPTELYSAHEAAIADAVKAEVSRTLGPGASVDLAHEITHPAVDGIAGAQFPGKILVNLFDPDAIGVARHEGIHFLKRSGVLSDGEWKILSAAAESEGWGKRYGIDDLYSHLDREGKTEEAVAEGYRDWARNRDSQPDTPVGRVFQKLAEFWDRLKESIRSITGQEPTAANLFEQIYRGDRATGEGGAGVAFNLDKDTLQTQFDNLRAQSLGLDAKSFGRIQKLVRERYAEDLAAALARAEKENKTRLTKEWRSNLEQVRKDVSDQIRQRPDVAADLFFGSGELFGTKLDKKYRLRASDLTDEQRSAIPRHYYGEDGLPIDDAALMFGYRSGDEMVRGIAEYNAGKEGLTPQEYLAKNIRDESNRVMEARYGKLDENILEDARDQALSQTNLDLLAEEMYAAGMQAGVPVVDKAVAKEWVKDQFGKMTLADVSSDRFMTEIGRHGRDAERALIAGDAPTAVLSLQKKFLNALLAAEARKLEKEVTSFDKTTKRMSAREIKTISPEYTNFVHQIMVQVGKPVRRSIQDLAEAIGHGEAKNLEDFVAIKSEALREVAVWPDLYDGSFRKPYQSLAADEFRAVKGSIDSLIHNGRDELKIERAGEAEDLDVVKAELKEGLARFKELKYDRAGERVGAAPKILRTYLASSIQMENLFHRWDKFDRDGPWNQTVQRALVEGTNQEATWRKDAAKKLADTTDGLDPRKLIPNDIWRSPHDGTLFNMDRGALRVAMLNAGTKSNLTKLAKGYNLDPAVVMDWINKHATKEDWKFVQGVWDIFKELKARSDTMYRSISGVAPESLPGITHDTPFGKVEGGYYPIIYHPEYEGTSRRMMGKDPLEQSNYVRASTPAGYTQGRTGYIAPLSLELDAMPGRMASVIHDTALRPAVINASKVFYDKGIRDTIAKHYGGEYRDLLVPYLQDVANSANQMTKAQSAGMKTSEFLRQNVISTLIGLNPGTVLKHGPTALVQSLREVGPVNFLREVKSLFSVSEETGQTNWDFAMKTSQELQRREMNWQETLSGATSDLVAKGGYDSLRQSVIKYAAKPVAFSDLLSATPTWLAEYRKSTEAGLPLGDAVANADRAVRQAHGSSAITNRPAIMRNNSLLGSWMTSVYGFFSHIMNRQLEMVWRAGESFDLAKAGDWENAKSTFTPVIGQVFAYAILPALIEEMVQPLPHDDHEHWAKTAAKGLAFTLGASWVGVRDIANAILHGTDPSVGLATTAAKELTNTVRNLTKDNPLSRDHRGRLIQDAAGTIGTLTGLLPQQVGKAARFVTDVNAGQQPTPRGPWGWLVGLRFGTTDKHSKTWDDYVKGRT